MINQYVLDMVARAIKDSRASDVNEKVRCEALDDVALALCVEFKIENPQFNRIRFLKACGVQL